MVKIYVGNLAKSARRDELQALFSKYGSVIECDILREFGFVHMDSIHEAEQAVKALHGFQFAGNALRVEISTGAKRESSRPAPRDRDRERDRSPLRNRGADRGDYYGGGRERPLEYDSYARGYAPSSSNNNSSYYAMLASAAAGVYHQLMRSGISDPQEVYHRMYLAISTAASQPPPLVGGGGGFDRPPQYSGGRYGNEPPYGGGSSSQTGSGGYRNEYDRRRF